MEALATTAGKLAELMPHIDPDRWQPLLPMPYRIIDELLTELVDATVFSCSLAQPANEAEQAADDDSGALLSPPSDSLAMPESIGAPSILATLDEHSLVVGAAGKLWIWLPGV